MFHGWVLENKTRTRQAGDHVVTFARDRNGGVGRD